MLYFFDMTPEIRAYEKALGRKEREICSGLARIIEKHLKNSESKVWHRHPVWFLDSNPVVGYSKLKAGVQLMFWSGRGFDEPLLIPGKGRFKDASIMYTDSKENDEKDIKRWLKKATVIQWDYKNIVKRKGKLVKLRSL